MDAHIRFIGQGWSFPPEFSLGGKEVMMVSDIVDIQHSLEILFGTRLGERIMREDYGSSLIDYPFEEMNQSILNRLRHMISDAILQFEPRIQLNHIELAPDAKIDGLLNIELDFTVLSSNSRFNMVYPFYLTEASN